MIDPVAVQIGPVSVYWYGIILTSAFILGTLLAYHHAGKYNIYPEHILNLVLLIIPAAIIGARLFYVMLNLDYYLANPGEIIATWHGGLAIHGGLFGGFIVGYLYVRKHRLNFWSMGDIIAPSIILGQVIGRWGNFINREAYGLPVSQEFISRFPGFIQKQMFINGQYHHPAFLYESLWNLSVFFVLMILLPRRQFHGQVLLFYLALYSLGRFFIEEIRMDTLVLGPLKTAQVASLLIMAAAAVIALYRIKKAGD